MVYITPHLSRPLINQRTKGRVPLALLRTAMDQFSPDDSMAEFFDFGAGSTLLPDESSLMQMQLDGGDFFADLSGTQFDNQLNPICTIHPGEK